MTYMSSWQVTAGRHMCRIGIRLSDDTYVALALRGLNASNVTLASSWLSVR